MVAYARHAAVLWVAVLLVSGCGRDSQPPPAIPFAPLTDDSLKDPDNPIKTFQVDFARVEQQYPLSRADRAKVTPENIAALAQEQIDQIYARLTAGPIPDGPYRGNLFFARDDSLDRRLQEVLGGVEGRLAGAELAVLETLAKTLWRGKMFFRDQRVARNLIDDVTTLKPLIVDMAPIPTMTMPRQGWLHYIWPTQQVWLLFPAKLYCGQSLLDGRRESVIVDYNYGDEVAGWLAAPDALAGRNGLRLRDEIRMVRPGFYLGRAYANRMFLLDFTLFNADVTATGAASFNGGQPIAEDCWPGEQPSAASANR